MKYYYSKTSIIRTNGGERFMDNQKTLKIGDFQKTEHKIENKRK